MAIKTNTAQPLIENAILGTGTSTVLYTVTGTGKRVIIKKVLFTNYNATESRLVSFYIVPDGENVADPQHEKVIDQELDSKEAWPCYQVQDLVLLEGWTIYAKASGGNSVSLIVSGVEVTG